MKIKCIASIGPVFRQAPATLRNLCGRARVRWHLVLAWAKVRALMPSTAWHNISRRAMSIHRVISKRTFCPLITRILFITLLEIFLKLLTLIFIIKNMHFLKRNFIVINVFFFKPKC